MNPVEYAEKQLGVHEVAVQAEALQVEYQEFAKQLVTVNDLIRSLSEKVEDREREIAAGYLYDKDYQSLSKTALREAISQAIHHDEQVIDLNRQLSRVKSNRSALEHDMKVRSQGIEIRVARMHELSGLLQFYAASKLASLQVKGSTGQ